MAPLVFCTIFIPALYFAVRTKDVRLHDVYVITYTDPFTYHLRAPIPQSNGTERMTDFWTTFCNDYEPLFSTGQTLKVLTYEDRGRCWSVAHTHPAYLIVRGEDGRPILR